MTLTLSRETQQFKGAPGKLESFSRYQNVLLQEAWGVARNWPCPRAGQGTFLAWHQLLETEFLCLSPVHAARLLHLT